MVDYRAKAVESSFVAEVRWYALLAIARVLMRSINYSLINFRISKFIEKYVSYTQNLRLAPISLATRAKTSSPAPRFPILRRYCAELRVPGYVSDDRHERLIYRLRAPLMHEGYPDCGRGRLSLT